MDYRANDPGAVQYGNFINYYQFNSAEERIKLLPTEIWENSDTKGPYFVLDVGCNAGVVTQLLYKFLLKHTKRKVHVLGIDIDPALIERASLSNEHPDITFQCVDITNKDQCQKLTDHLARFGRRTFDATFCLSITMWIHLNHGDDGLREFLAKCANISAMLIIEPQPWKCYQTAVKRLRKANDDFNRFGELQWRSNVEDAIQAHLERALGRTKLYETAPTKWKRKICMYSKTLE